MTKVQISETYAIGCGECLDRLLRVVQWSCRDAQVTGLNMKCVPRCEHALPVVESKAVKPGTLREMARSSAGASPSPPTHAANLFPDGGMAPDTLAGTGYDEPGATG